MSEATAPSVDTGSSNYTRLSIMMFLQFFLWGAWFVTLGYCLGKHGLSDIIGDAYGSAPIAAIIAPLFLGLVADRFFSSERVMGVLLLVGGVFMCLVPHYAEAGKADVIVWLFIAHMLCYMPTLGLGNSIAFSNITDQNLFPKIRVWGTIGWIVAGLVIGFLGWSGDLRMFWIAGICSLVLGLYSFTLPHTPPPAKDQKLSLRTLFMVDAFSMMAKPAFLVFIVCSTLICIPLAYYYGFTSNFLGNEGFAQPASSMSIGQMSEIFFMILIPFFLVRLGVKYMILVGMAAWAARYALFAFGAPDHVWWMLFLAIALHGVCYDFFFVTGFMYTETNAKKEVKSQAQSMLVFFTQGVGMYVGYEIAGGRFGGTVTKYQELTDAIEASHAGEATPTFLEQLGQMFSVSKPQVDPQLLSETTAQWKEFWTLPAYMAAGILILFFLTFWDKSKAGAAPDAE